MIYFARIGEGGPVKIGCAWETTLEMRLAGLRCKYKKPVVLLCWLDGGFKEEKEIHERFARLRLPGNKLRELFRLGRDMANFIVSHGGTVRRSKRWRVVTWRRGWHEMAEIGDVIDNGRESRRSATARNPGTEALCRPSSGRPTGCS